MTPITIRNASLYEGDCLEVMRSMPDNAVDSIVTDPPYGLSFMGKKWDYNVPSVDVWTECLRVLKPGGYLLAFAGTRTQHRMAVRIEDAGFEIRDMIAWVYGSGFPKSHNGEWGGTALKPALEPITMARKPLVGTVEANWREHGTGALNIAACRVGSDVIHSNGNSFGAQWRGLEGRDDLQDAKPSESIGRWPANIIHDGSDEVVGAFPNAKGQLADVSETAPSAKTSNVYGAMARRGEPSADSENEGAVGFKMKPGARLMDTGSAARFFYCPKASKGDRDEGLDAFALKALAYGNQAQAEVKRGNTEHTGNSGINTVKMRANHHPTVKPIDLMAYLVRLVTPPGGVVLDPFMGSGSTGKAAVRERMRFVGCEMSREYMEIARARIEHEARLGAQMSLSEAA
jgi:site-specific DNA-methyltransferase (adenine-specific)